MLAMRHARVTRMETAAGPGRYRDPRERGMEAVAWASGLQ